MKKLEIVIRPEKLAALKKILEGCKANGIMISNIMGYGNQKGYTQMYRGTTYVVNLLPKVKVETVVPEAVADAIVEQAVKEIGMVVEGYYAAPNAKTLADKLGVEMPITEAAYAVLYGGKDPKTVVAELMTRDKKPESEESWV